MEEIKQHNQLLMYLIYSIQFIYCKLAHSYTACECIGQFKFKKIIIDILSAVLNIENLTDDAIAQLYVTKIQGWALRSFLFGMLRYFPF